MSGNQKQQQTGHQNQANVKAGKTQQKTTRTVNPDQMLSAPETLRSEDVLAAQQQVGNQVVQRALDKKGRDQRATDSQGNLSEDLTKQIQSKRGGGSPLPDVIQKDASKKLGRKFNDVRIHTDETADKLSRSVSARAFTIGKDIFFKGGVFSPTSSAGRETLIHELTHVVQQSSSKTSSGGKLKLGAPDTAMEKEAAHMGKKHASQPGAATPAAGAVQRQEEEEELQMQEDEEELQMQPDANAVLQRQEEEEELQMQPDPNVAIQREPEEEELQMQKDPSGSLIQRSLEGDLQEEMEKRKAKSSKVPDAPKMAPPPLNNAKLTLKEQIAKTKEKKKSDLKAGSKLGLDGKSLENAKKGPESIGKAVFDPESVKKDTAKMQKEEKKKVSAEAKKAAEEKKKLEKRMKLAVSNPKKLSEMDAKAKAKEESSLAKANAKEDSKAYTGSRIKDPIPPKTTGTSDKKETASVDAKADPAKEEKKEAGKSSKVGGMFKKGLGFLGSKIKGIAKNKLKDAKEHYLGKKEEEKEDKKEEKGVTVNVNNAGAGGGGGGGMAETISDLFQENKKLKAENAELKKKKEEVPVV